MDDVMHANNSYIIKIFPGPHVAEINLQSKERFICNDSVHTTPSEIIFVHAKLQRIYLNLIFILSYFHLYMVIRVLSRVQ
jgi:hypothetical protein